MQKHADVMSQASALVCVHVCTSFPGIVFRPGRSRQLPFAVAVAIAVAIAVTFSHVVPIAVDLCCFYVMSYLLSRCAPK